MKTRIPAALPALCGTLAAILAATARLPAEDSPYPEHWPQYRGTAGDGLAGGATLPTDWGEDKNLVWRAAIPGWGWSSPIVHGDRIFATSAVSEKRLPVPPRRRPLHPERQPEESFLEALDMRTGTPLWRVGHDEQSTWSTPFVWENEHRTELVTIGSNKIRSYDPETPRESWPADAVEDESKQPARFSVPVTVGSSGD